MTEAPKEIWAWYFTPSKQDDVIKGGWDDAPDRKCTHYTRTDTIPTWQPIETAPKDETHILVYARWDWDGMYGEGCDKKYAWQVASWCKFSNAFINETFNPYVDYAVKPLAWAPLPPAPEES